MTPLVTIKRRTIVVVIGRHGEHRQTEPIRDCAVAGVIEYSLRKGERPAYLVRCRPRRRSPTPDWIPLDS